METNLRNAARRMFMECYADRWPFVVSALVAAAVHYPIYAYQLRNMDSLHVGSLYVADEWDFHPYWETAQGRWGLRLIDLLRGGINLPPLSAFLMLLFFLLAGLLVVRLFGLHGRVARFLIPVLIVCAPYVAEVETFHYCSAAYGLSYLLAVLAVFAAVWAPPRWGWAAGAVCLMFSLSMYQASLGVAAGLCLMVLLLELLRTPQPLRHPGGLLLRMAAMGVSGSIAYAVILKLFLKLYDVGMFGAYAEGPAEVIKGIPSGIMHAYSNFWAYFTQNNVSAQNYYGQRLAYLLLAAAALISLVRWLAAIHRVDTTLLAVVLLLLLPVAVNVTDILNANTQIELRMTGALVLMAPFALALLEHAPCGDAHRLPGAVLAGALCGVILLRGYVVQISNDSLVMLDQKNKIVNLANRICLQLEQNADYQAGAQVCILGEPQKGMYADVSPLSEKASKLAGFGLLSYDPTFNSRGWHSLYWEELGIKMNWCSDEETRALCASDTFQSMPIYPQEGCIRAIDGVVVVKVAEIQ